MVIGTRWREDERVRTTVLCGAILDVFTGRSFGRRARGPWNVSDKADSNRSQIPRDARGKHLDRVNLYSVAMFVSTTFLGKRLLRSLSRNGNKNGDEKLFVERYAHYNNEFDVRIRIRSRELN